ncbi:ABC transporter substrate-binding protein [Streptomyces chromofuscus]|uniref:ABC transporter substrate-binding protein n=1 Tax=Streptomyces chromofuscus TaxID=42881 RepID=A0A7M2T8Q6_STRCW|nr:ABC transporter substrate-binding protein [Streptomyces chromofuscus]QOV44634.1 ABC transporter substrate-binding protein [Streptomyces chromofuscus]GGT01665.1 ABC transporter substrate-binding protein [Streptomyces chromofuscus]
MVSSSHTSRRRAGSRAATKAATVGRRPAWAVAVVAASLATTLVGCGGDSSEPAADSPGKFSGRGPITLATGKDTTGTIQEQLDRWNSEHPNEKVTLVELPESADQQRQQFIQNAQTKSDAYTVLNLDPIWVAEFAANQWIDELPAGQFPLDKMLPAVVMTGEYFGKQYAIPYNTNAGLLFYRQDLLDKAGVQPPTTWDDMKDACAAVAKLPEGKDVDCYAGQFDKYEGLTVNFSEAVASAGGTVVDAEGRATVDTEEAKKGLQFLTDGFKDGTFPEEASTYQEEDGRRAFQAGKLLFHRQWPYQWALANAKDGSSKVAGKFGVAPLPGLDGPGKSSLGGLDLAVSKFAKNKATALDFIKFFSSEANARTNLKVNSAAPPYAGLYDDPALRRQFPYLATLKESLSGAVPRPVVVQYGDATAAIQESAAAALSGSKSVDAALADMQRDLSAAIAEK